ncbi:uncharacterized protein LOC118404067 [Branchiostoma floridae]|uniref:Uncharacterized protein LOC118404067 n=1 Tax=Branchiostoma floridae TaxID=7739 RepID=A0A9J7HFX4_BRAFL|nr:uncharacterized protein LOC118404067 [Branchiostoma floridae]
MSGQNSLGLPENRDTDDNDNTAFSHNLAPPTPPHHLPPLQLKGTLPPLQTTPKRPLPKVVITPPPEHRKLGAVPICRVAPVGVSNARRSRRLGKKWMVSLIAAGVLTVIGIALALGLGIGLKQ